MVSHFDFLPRIFPPEQEIDNPEFFLIKKPPNNLPGGF